MLGQFLSRTVHAHPASFHGISNAFDPKPYEKSKRHQSHGEESKGDGIFRHDRKSSHHSDLVELERVRGHSDMDLGGRMKVQD